MTNYFASARAGAELHCERFGRGEAPVACHDAHADVVLWASWTSFASNTVVSVVLVSANMAAQVQAAASRLAGRRECSSVAPTAQVVRKPLLRCPGLGESFAPGPRSNPRPVSLHPHPAQVPLLGNWSDVHGRRPFLLLALGLASAPLLVVLGHVTTGFPLKWYYLVQVI